MLYLGEQVDMYFEMNTTKTSASVRWDAFKAFIRDPNISYISIKM